MRPNLPKNATLKKKIGRKEVQFPLHFLSNHRGELAPYRTVEDLVFNLDGPHPTAIDTIEVHLRKVSWKFRKSRYSYSIFIGASVLDQILCDKIRDTTVADPIKAALSLIREEERTPLIARGPALVAQRISL
jgi:hypothetical protein